MSNNTYGKLNHSLGAMAAKSGHGDLLMYPDYAQEILNNFISEGKISLSEVAIKQRMIKEEKLKEIGLNLDKIKYRTNGKQVYIHVGAKLCRQYGVKDQFLAANTDALINQLYSAFFKISDRTLNDIFDYSYCAWRISVGTKSKTVKEDTNEYNRFFRNSEIGSKRPCDIKSTDIRDLFLLMTANHEISKTRFNSAKGVLNGLLQHCLEKGYIDHNPLQNVSRLPLKKRFKPIERKDDYTAEEIYAICDYLAPSNNIYDIAIRFDFCLCARICELKSLKYEDIQRDLLKIRRSVSYDMDATINKDGSVSYGSEMMSETVIKGAAKEGFRDYPLIDEAIKIAKKVHFDHPDWEYLFMSNGKPLRTVTFNRRLKKACESLGIQYRSSQIIRFTNCDRLYHEAGVAHKDMQSLMGHTTPTMTDHYLNNHGISDESRDKIKGFLHITNPVIDFDEDQLILGM